MGLATLFAFVGGAASAAAVMSSEASRELARQVMVSALKRGIIAGRAVMRRAHEMNDDLQDLIAETAAETDRAAANTKATDASVRTDGSVRAVRG